MSLQFLTWRQWRQRPGRALLTVLSVAIAVAAVLGTAFAQSTVRRAYESMNAALEGPPVLDIVTAGGGRFPPGDAPRMDNLPGVVSIAPLVFRATTVRYAGNSWRTLAVGLGDDTVAWSRLKLTGGRLPRAAGEALLEAGQADSLELKPEQTVTVLARRGTATLNIVGTVSAPSLRELGEGASLAMSLETAQSVFGVSSQVDRIRIQAATPERRDQLQDEIGRLLPAHLKIQAPAGRLRLADELLRSTELALQFAGALALAMAGFIILNTLRMNFTERRREFALLQAIGASQRQIRRLLWVEACLLGGLGAAVGLPLGLLLARGVSQGMQAILNVQLPAAWPSAAAVALGVFVGPAVALIAAWFPVREARRISPLEGIAGIEPGRSDRYPWQTLLASLIVWTAAVLCLALVFRETVPGRLAIPAGLTMLIAFILLIPAVMGPMVAGLAALLPRQWQAEALLASRQIQQRRTQASLTVGVLVVAISNGLGLGHAILNNIGDVQDWYRRNMSGDYVLRPVRAADASNPLDAEAQILADLNGVPAVAGVTNVRIRTARVAGERVLCIIRDFASDRSLPWNLSSKEEAALRRDLAAGKAVISSVLARRLPPAADKALRLELQGRTHAIAVAAEVNDYTFGGLAIFLDRRAAAGLIDLGSADLFLVTCAPDQTAAALPSLESIARDRGLALQSFVELRHGLDAQIGGISGALYVLMAVGFLVGGFGVANTLAMSVLEQTRELGLLRIAGMSRRRIGRLVLVEALFLSLASVCLGVLAGMTTALVIHLCNRALLDRDVPFHFHPWLLAGNVAVCLLVAACAAWIPGRRASRIDVLSAISYE